MPATSHSNACSAQAFQTLCISVLFWALSLSSSSNDKDDLQNEGREAYCILYHLSWAGIAARASCDEAEYLESDEAGLCQVLEILTAAVQVHDSLLSADDSIDVMHKEAGKLHAAPALDACGGVLSRQALQNFFILQCHIF